MPECPNCGLATQRTKDWVCMWCGYPLVSNAYKVIDKTFKELQDERKANLRPAAAEVQPEPEPEYRPAPEPKKPLPQRPVNQQRPPAISYPKPQPSREADIEPESILINPSPPPKEVIITPPPLESPVQAQPKEEILPDPAVPVPPEIEEETPPESTAPEETETEEETPPVVMTPPPLKAVAPEPAPQPEPSPAPKQPLPAAKPEFNMEPEPEPLPPELMLEPEDIENGMEIAVEQIDALFKAQPEAAHAAFTGKTFIIQGIVEKIFIREHLDIRYILLTGVLKGITWSLRCTFEKENARSLTGIQEGQAVKLQGKYDGVGKNIIFKDCVII